MCSNNTIGFSINNLKSITIISSLFNSKQSSIQSDNISASASANRSYSFISLPIRAIIMIKISVRAITHCHIITFRRFCQWLNNSHIDTVKGNLGRAFDFAATYSPLAIKILAATLCPEPMIKSAAPSSLKTSPAARPIKSIRAAVTPSGRVHSPSLTLLSLHCKAQTTS